MRNMLGGLTCGAGVAAVLIAIMGTVSAHGTQAVSAVAASESAAANQAAAHANAVALLGEVFEDLTITRQVAADGKPNSGFVSYFRLNRALGNL